MKKLLITLLLLTPFVTGCANIETRVNINKDKSATVATSLTYQGNLADKSSIEAQNIEANYAKLLDSLYKVDKAYSPKLSTINATKKTENLKYADLDLSSLGFVTKLTSGRYVEIKKNFLITSYNVDLVFNYKNLEKKFEITQTSIPAQISGTLNPEYYNKYIDASEVQGQSDSGDFEKDMASNLDDSAKQLFVQDYDYALDESSPSQPQAKNNDVNISFSIQVPSFASFNNANSVDGNVYTWNISTDEPTEIKFQYVQYSPWAIAFVILLGILVLVFIARRIIKRDTQKRLDNIENIV